MHSTRTRRTLGNHHHSVSIALVSLSCALTIAACSSSSSTLTGSGTTASGNSSAIALSKCMRAHGVPNFPDPTQGPGGEGLSINGTPGSSALTVDGMTLSGPAFQAARKACKEFLPGGGGPPPKISESQKRAALANAQCMREHGVPTFPDPTFPARGGILIAGGPGVNPQSPAFKQAAAACGREIR
jgi:hypothetical protein